VSNSAERHRFLLSLSSSCQVGHRLCADLTEIAARIGSASKLYGFRKIAKHKFYAVVNFAAESHGDRSISDPGNCIHTNVIGTQMLLESAHRHSVKRFVQISTDEVYGPLGPRGRFTESSPISRSSPYSASKAAADLLVLAARKIDLATALRSPAQL
jgi:dTDP-D-glucose 4,6-dehydratase